VPDHILPDHPSVEQYKKQAKELLSAATGGEPAALARMRKHRLRLHDLALDRPHAITLSGAQFVLAREHGYESWPAFAKHIETLRIIRSVEDLADPLNTFIQVACVDRHGWHASGTVEHADLILARYPDAATGSIYSAAVLGDEAAVNGWLARDASLATTTGGPHNWDALTYLCFSRYLRIEKTRSEAFVSTARALLEAGANPNTGWIEYIDDPPRPIHEAVIYGAAGLAQDPGLTKLLLDHGADPNDEETPYHVSETYDNTVVEILVRSGRFNKVSLTTVAVRKCDWHDDKGLELALDHGADPNYLTRWGYSLLQHAIRRDNGLVMIDAILDRKADPYLLNNDDGRNAIQMAAYHGRGDILASLERRGFDIELDGIDSLVAACARADLETARSIATSHPRLLGQLLSMGGALLARFAGTDNDAGVRCLLALGVPAAALWSEGDPYWELSQNSTALHVAAWRAHYDVVRTLIAAGSPVNALDARNRTALQLAVRACTSSYWKYRRKPDSVAALLAAGAATVGVDLPTGYDAIDDLLRLQKEALPEDR
jgi:ankyrin repeat protein